MLKPVQPLHGRKIGLVSFSGVDPSGVPIRHPVGSFEALRLIQNEIEAITIDTGFLSSAPFSWVTLAILFEQEGAGNTEFSRINRTYGDLPLTVQLAGGTFRGLDREGVIDTLRTVVIQALIDAGEKYERPTAALRSLLQGHTS